MVTAAQGRSLRRPGKLYRVLTPYVATKCRVSHPENPVVEKPCRVGGMVGFTLVDEQFGYGPGGSRELQGFHLNRPGDAISGTYYTDGETPVSFQINEWVCEIFNDGAGTAAQYSTVYYHDTAHGPVGDVNYNLVIGGSANDRDAIAGMLMSGPIASKAVDKGAILLLNSQAGADLRVAAAASAGG